jgi:regulatory protein
MTSRPKPKPEAYDAAVALLARREHSRAELQRKLTQREHAADDIEAALDALERERLLSDARFAEQFVRGRIERGSGPHKIRAELRERGVADDVAADALAGHTQAWRERVHEVRRKRFGDAVPADYRERVRQMRFLQTRGFDAEQIRAAFEE